MKLTGKRKKRKKKKTEKSAEYFAKTDLNLIEAIQNLQTKIKEKSRKEKLRRISNEKSNFQKLSKTT